MLTVLFVRKMNTKEKYLQAPLYLWREFFIKPDEVMDKIMDIGIYKFAQNNYSNYQEHRENIAKQLMYGYYRDKNFNRKIYDKIQSYNNEGSIDIDEDYNGFNGDTFNPEYELPGLLKILDTDEDLRYYATIYHGIKLACRNGNLNIKLSDIDQEIINGKQILSKMPPGDPWIMVNVERAWDFLKHKKQDFELAQFAAHIAIKSIVGTKPYCKTNKAHITARMFGYASAKHVPAKLPKDILLLYDKYSKRWWMDKVLQMLELNWGIKIYSNGMRGIYVSTSKSMTMDNLAEKAEKQTLKNRVAALKQQKKEAREKALQHLNDNDHDKETTLTTAEQQQLK